MKIKAKKCTKCGKTKALYDFYKNLTHSDKLRSECKRCSDKLIAAWRQNPLNIQTYKKQCNNANARRKQINKAERDKLKIDVLDAYGGKCACCGEAEPIFLTIDHIKGGGTKHRNSITKNSIGLYRWLRQNNYPKGFQVLCFNCNRGKHFNNGICPHKPAALIAKELAKESQ